MEEDEYEAWVELAESSQVMTAADGNSVILGVGHRDSSAASEGDRAVKRVAH